ncbi:MAG: Addiction module antitoxin, RelB/DinJ family [uncultured bacterium]|nr:MAG: Addiction module antitoxin, RelB/DinJ family [uncultured bacterium]
MTTIQVRIDNKTKQSAQKVLNQLGLDMSSAIKVYLKQITLHNGIPLRLVTPNGLTPDDEQTILQASAEAKRGHNVTKPLSVKQAIQYLKDL